MPQEWTEGRLDELNAKVDRGFKRVDADVRELRMEIRDEFKAMRSEIGGIQRTMLFGAISMTGAILAGFAGICTLLAGTL